MKNFSQTINFIWKIADSLHGDYKSSKLGWVLLLFLVPRRLGQVMEQARDAVRQADKDQALFPGRNFE